MSLLVYPLKRQHTFGLDAHCNAFIEMNTLDDLRRWVSVERSEPHLILGEGSNCIFIDDFEGTVVAMRILGKSRQATEYGDLVSVGAGENWHDFVVWCLENDLYGLENLALIPGTVGASPIQNIGAYGVEVEAFIHSVDVLDFNTNKLTTLTKHECQFAYRDSIFKQDLFRSSVVVRVNFVFPKKWQAVVSYGALQKLVSPTPRAIFDSVVALRKQKLPDPSTIGNSGSFFKNPVVSRTCYENIVQCFANDCDYGDPQNSHHKGHHEAVPCFTLPDQKVKVPAAWLIEKAGFKGQHYGGVQVHPQHALVLTNANNAKGEEVLAFARHIVKTVYERFNVKLDNEVRLIGKQGVVAL